MNIPQTLWVYERHTLPLAFIHPQDEIRIEVIRLKETDSLATLIAQQINLLACKKVVFMLIIILADMTDESLLAGVQRHWRYLYERFVGILIHHYLFSTVIPVPKAKQREIQMAVEAQGLNPLSINLEVALHIARQYLLAQFPELVNPLLLVLSHLHVVFLEEIRVIGIHIHRLHKLRRFLPIFFS